MRTIPNWKEKFAHDFRTKKFTWESLEENTEQAIKYFTDYFTSEIETARREGREEMKQMCLASLPEQPYSNVYYQSEVFEAISSLK